MTLKEFLLTKTKSCELCVIRDSGYIVATIWIDNEDLFQRNLPPQLGKQEVWQDRWGVLPVMYDDGFKRNIGCHYIDIK